MVHIFTHNDLDGYAAGYVILQTFGKENCEITHLNYEKEPALEKVKLGDTVYVTDYSFTNDQFRQLLNLVGDDGHVIWCDHHITAINRYQNEDDLYLEGIRSTKYCGAVLIWCYFNDFDTEDIETMPYEQLCERLPRYLRVVDAWDTWKLDSMYREDAEALNTSVVSRLSDDMFEDVANNLQKYIDTGKQYIDFRNQWSKQFRDKYMFEKILPGELFGTNRKVTAAILNIGCANSTYFGDAFEKYDVCITMCFNGTFWNVSVYSNRNDINCSLYCEMHGGGGHKGAAGCTFEQITPPGFILNDDEEIIVKEKKKDGKI